MNPFKTMHRHDLEIMRKMKEEEKMRENQRKRAERVEL